MSDPSETPWSSHPNAPQISSRLYIQEKESFAGLSIGLITYGIVGTLFFRCMGVLLSPTNPMKNKIKWALVVHTLALFFFLTVPLGVELNNSSTAHINDREFPGDGEIPPGPSGYDYILYNKPTFTVFNFMFPLNQWLADGLLLHRCFVIYSENHSAMAFPYLLYLASVAVGTAHIYEFSAINVLTDTSINFNTSYYSICLSLNVILTLMIVIRLVVHIRNVRKATGASDGSTGLHTATATVVAILIESYALYAIALLLYIVPWVISSPVVDLFSKALGTMQVIAPYLIILRVAKQRALTSESISGVTESIHFRSQGTSDGDGSVHDGESMNSTGMDGEAPGDPRAGGNHIIEEVPL